MSRLSTGRTVDAGGGPVRVLIACDHIDYDGALHGGGRQLIELARALDRRLVDPTVCVLRGASTLGAELRAEGLPFHFFGDARFSPVSLIRLLWIIRRDRIEVVHLTDFGACTLGRIAARLAGIPSIVQVISHHSPGQPRGFPRYVELAYRALAPHTSRVLAISDSVRDFAVKRMGFAPGSVEVLTYPLPRHSFAPATADAIESHRATHGIAAGDPVVGAVTRFYPAKGIEHLIDAFAVVRRAHPGAWLVLVGQGPEEAALRARAKELAIADRVVFTGFQRDAQAYVGGFDVAAVPSIEEGFGLVALEALALGVPVVASRVGGLPDIVVDGVTGVLVEPARPEALAGAIVRLLGDPALRRQMGAAAKLDVQRFSLDAYSGRLSEIYRELAAKSTRAPQAAAGGTRSSPSSAAHTPRTSSPASISRTPSADL
ncbi:MAG: glycosyltransferase [Gemmatimonadaceae bacterium]